MAEQAGPVDGQEQAGVIVAIVDILRETYPPPVEATGKLFLVVEHDALCNPVGLKLEWSGGDTIPIAYELFEQYPLLLRSLLGRYNLHIVADSPELKTLYARRVD